MDELIIEAIFAITFLVCALITFFMENKNDKDFNEKNK